MKFLLQKEIIDSIELHIVKDLLDKDKVLHEYVIDSMDNVSKYYENMIPIGNIPFVQKWLSTCKGVNRMIPIEIPDFFRNKNYFLHRQYNVVPYEKLPRIGNWFIKDCTTLKNGTYAGNVENSYQFNFETLDKSHMFVVSECVEPLSEYRIYVIDDKIEGVVNYDGDVSIFPNVNFVKMVQRLMSSKVGYNGYKMRSYSFDVMIHKVNDELVSSLIEVHPFACIGLYSTLWGTNLLYAYKDGIDFYINNH